MLAPSVKSSRTVAHCTLRRPPWMDATVPSSSMIPVNIQVSFHRELVRGDVMNGDAVDANGVGTAAAADAAGERQSFEAAENLGAVVEEHTIDDAVFESAPVDLTARFDHQRKILLAAQPVDQAAEIGAASGTIEDKHLDAAALDNFAALGGRRGRGHQHDIAGSTARHFRIEGEAE